MIQNILSTHDLGLIFVLVKSVEKLRVYKTKLFDKGPLGFRKIMGKIVLLGYKS